MRSEAGFDARIDLWPARAAATAPSSPAILFRGETWSYEAFARRIDDLAETLEAIGLRRGDRVGWLGLNHPKVFTLLFACARLGAVLVPFNWRLAAAELARIAEDCGPRLILHDDEFAHQAAALAGPGRVIAHHARAIPPLKHDPEPRAFPAPDPIRGPEGFAHENGAEAPLLIVYTSGATGRPKGAVLPVRAVAANAAMSVAAHGLTRESRALVVLPLFHVGGLNILPTPSFSIGAAVEIHERFEPAAALAALAGGVTHAIMVPTVAQAIMAQPGWAAADLSRLRALSIGSTDVPREIIDAVHARLVPMPQIYGATETGPFAIYQTVADAMENPGSIGRPGALCEIRLARPDGSEAAPGEPGEILVKGPNILSGYWRNEEETARAIVDGWFHTGDIALRDEAGLFWFADRIKHVVISGGENIYPAELERVLRPHPKVREVAVVGRPDPKWGEVPVAVIAPREPMTEAEALSAFNGVLARYKHPRAVVFVDALPRNAMGKVVAAEVRAMIGAG
ncbi:MAG: AMP-binding protein [Pikeienuella sp.]|uniref:AMP-binding protein n=1 Tax=Pikeienuella sp. TaxID=2831957 RepID=UPI003919D014